MSTVQLFGVLMLSPVMLYVFLFVASKAVARAVYSEKAKYTTWLFSLTPSGRNDSGKT